MDLAYVLPAHAETLRQRTARALTTRMRLPNAHPQIVRNRLRHRPPTAVIPESSSFKGQSSFAYIYSDTALNVEHQQVIPVQACARGRSFEPEAGMGAVEVVVVQPELELFGALG